MKINNYRISSRPPTLLLSPLATSSDVAVSVKWTSTWEHLARNLSIGPSCEYTIFGTSLERGTLLTTRAHLLDAPAVNMLMKQFLFWWSVLHLFFTRLVGHFHCFLLSLRLCLEMSLFLSSATVNIWGNFCSKNAVQVFHLASSLASAVFL